MLRSFLKTYRPVLVLVVVAACAEAAYAAINMLALQVYVKEVLNLTAYLGIILGAFLVVEALLKSVMGALADRYGRWKFLSAAPVVSGCTALLIVALGSIAQRQLGPGGMGPPVYRGWLPIVTVLTPLLVIRAIDGVAAAAFWPTMFATMADTAPAEHRTSAMSTLTVAYMVGVALGPPLAGWANDESPLARRGTPTVTELRLLSSAAPRERGAVDGTVVAFDEGRRTIVVSVPKRNFLTRRVTDQTRTFRLNDETHLNLGEAADDLAALRPGARVRLLLEGNKEAAFVIVSILFFATAVLAFVLVPREKPHPAHKEEHERPLRLSDLTIAWRMAPSLVITALVVFVAVGALAPVAPLYAKLVFRLSDAAYGRMFIAPAILIGVLTLPIGRLSDVWGRTNSVKVGIGLAFGAIALMTAVAVLPSLAAFRSATVLSALATVMGLGFVMGLPAWLSTVADIAGEGRRAQMIGAVATAEGLGAFAGNLVSPIFYRMGLDPHRPGLHYMVHAPMVMATFFLGLGFVIALVTIRPVPHGEAQQPVELEEFAEIVETEEIPERNGTPASPAGNPGTNNPPAGDSATASPNGAAGTARREEPAAPPAPAATAPSAPGTHDER